jgi:hypothetical protein
MLSKTNWTTWRRQSILCLLLLTLMMNTWLVSTVRAQGVGPLIGAMFDPREIEQYCEEMQSNGVAATTLTVPWNAIEPRKGTFRWQQADPVIQQMRSCGLTLGVHVLANATWAVQPSPAGDQRISMPPVNMQDYYDFIFQLASHYRGQISRYSIENEAASPNNWGGTAAEYAELLATAYAAIQAADPDALVLNDGMSSSALGFLYAAELYQQGQQQAAVDFLSTFYAHFAPGRQAGQPIQVETPQEFAALLDNALAQEVSAWLAMLVQNQDVYDAFQVHYYGPPEQLVPVMDWIDAKLVAQGPGKPLELWELGYGWSDAATLDLQAQSAAVVRLLATAVGEGVPFIIYWRYTDQVEQAGTGVTGLVTTAGPRPAVDVFRLISEKLDNMTQATNADLGPGIEGYVFHLASGSSLYVIWSTEGAQTISMVDAAGDVAIVTITGEMRPVDAQSVEVGPEPLILEVN